MSRISFGFYITFVILASLLGLLSTHIYQHNLISVIYPYENPVSPVNRSMEVRSGYDFEDRTYSLEEGYDYRIYIMVFGGEEDQAILTYFFNDTELGEFKQVSGGNMSLFNKPESAHSFLPKFHVNQSGILLISTRLEFEFDNIGYHEIHIYRELPEFYLREVVINVIFTGLGLGFWTIAYFKYQKVVEKFNSIPTD